MLKANNRNARTRFKICSKLIRKTTEWYHGRRSGALHVNFKHTLRLVLLFRLLTFNR